ncbi:tautomerase family protein [Longispora albida]|uniref:tautomerase family protein n=1 Tax=Longispora albida TaxID=203523 RepID=UPI0004763954|nr:4-oxalocrotonate tautomerase family protein [Longispora albida]
MPMITVEMYPGRTPEQKQALAARLTEAFMETCGSPGQSPDGVWVVIREVPRENWAIGGKMHA